MPTTGSLTILFTDLVGSTELAYSLSPQAADELRRSHFACLREVLEGSGGAEVKNLGDGLMVSFPASSTAVACAVAMQQAVDAQNRRSAAAARPAHRRRRRRGRLGGRRLLW